MSQKKYVKRDKVIKLRCKNCGSEWKNRVGDSAFVNCPFCGKKLNDIFVSEDSMDGILRSIFDQFGQEILLDKRKFIAVFNDVAPKMKLEKNMLSVALDQGIAHYYINTAVQDREFNIKNSIQELQIIMSSEAITRILSSFILALDWDERLLSILNGKTSNTPENDTDSSKVEVVCIFKNKKWKLLFDESMSVSEVQKYMEDKKYIPSGLLVYHTNAYPFRSDIFDGAELTFYKKAPEWLSGGPLYGCPTAKDISGSVPSCMLTSFDGFIESEV